MENIVRSLGEGGNMEPNGILAVRDTLLRSALNRVNNAMAELAIMKSDLEENKTPLFGHLYLQQEIAQLRELCKTAEEIVKTEREEQ